MDYVLLGKRLRELRKRKGLTQDQVAEALGVTGSNVSLIEAGRVRTPVDRLELFADVVGGRLDLVLVDSDTEELLTRLAALLPDLPPALRRTLAAQIDLLEAERG